MKISLLIFFFFIFVVFITVLFSFTFINFNFFTFNYFFIFLSIFIFLFFLHNFFNNFFLFILIETFSFIKFTNNLNPLHSSNILHFINLLVKICVCRYPLFLPYQAFIIEIWNRNMLNKHSTTHWEVNITHKYKLSNKITHWEVNITHKYKLSNKKEDTYIFVKYFTRYHSKIGSTICFLIFSFTSQFIDENKLFIIFVILLVEVGHSRMNIAKTWELCNFFQIYLHRLHPCPRTLFPKALQAFEIFL